MLAVVDFETYYDPPHYGLRNMTTEEYIRSPLFESIGFSLKLGNQPAQWHTGDAAYQLSVLRQVDWSKTAMAGHNNRFDAAILNWRFGLRPAKYIDTMSMARGLVGLHTSCSLEKLGEYFQLKRRKGHEVVKAAGKRRADFSPTEMEAYGSYCVNDTEMCFDLLQIMAPLTLAEEMRLQDWTIRAYVEPKLQLNEAVLREELAAYMTRRATLLHACGVLDVSVLRSDEAMAAALRSVGVEPPTKLSPKQKNADGTAKRVWAFSKQDLEFMELLESDDEQVVGLAEARIGAKSSIVESRLKRLIGISQRGPMPMPMVYAGATPTRRWSGDDNINVQNFPRNKVRRNPDNTTMIGPDGQPVIDFSPLRRAIEAPPGKKMAAADLSQIELRVNAWQSGQHDVLHLLRAGGDVYSDQATALYGYEVTKKTGKTIHQVERFVGKTTELQCGYQCGAEKFLHSLKVAAKRDGMVLPDTSIEFGARTVTGYRNKRALIKKFWYTAQQNLEHIAYGTTSAIGPYPVKDCKIWLPNGSYLYYPDLRLMEKEGEGEIGTEWSYERVMKGRKMRRKMYGGKLVENITQAVARLFVSDALLRLETVKYADGRKVFDVVFSVHDELVVLFDEGLDERWVEDTLKWAMTTNPYWAPDLPLDCEVGIARNYAECK
jgi:DNA polymerase